MTLQQQLAHANDSLTHRLKDCEAEVSFSHHDSYQCRRSPTHLAATRHKRRHTHTTAKARQGRHTHSNNATHTQHAHTHRHLRQTRRPTLLRTACALLESSQTMGSRFDPALPSPPSSCVIVPTCDVVMGTPVEGSVVPTATTTTKTTTTTTITTTTTTITMAVMIPRPRRSKAVGKRAPHNNSEIQLSAGKWGNNGWWHGRVTRRHHTT